MKPAVVAVQLGWTVWATIWLAAAMWQRRTVARPSRRDNRAHNWLQLAGFVALLVVMPGQGGWWLTAPLWLLPPALDWAMVAALLGAIAFACWARVALGNLWSAAVTRKEDHHLVEAGPYRLVRHPIYTGLIAAAFATAAVKATPLAIAGCLLLTIGFTLKARLEERFLGAELGEGSYASYRARVPMLVPFAPRPNVDRVRTG